MIRHPNQVARISVALDLLCQGSCKWYSSSVSDGIITVTTGPKSTIQTFKSEEAYLVWLLHEIKTTAAETMDWFSRHHGISLTEEGLPSPPF